MKFSVYKVSHKAGREINEDRLAYHYTREAVLLVLADGMGGHPEGEKAADIAVRFFVRQFADQAVPRLVDPRAFLEDTVVQANQAIVSYAHQQAMSDNPRTTLVAAVVQGGELTVLHSGDSRLYWGRQGRLVQRTRDHSYHDKPELFKQLPTSLNRSVLFTCLGSETVPLFDVLGPQPLQHGDRLLLCSDGLWAVLPDDELALGLHGQPLKDAINQLAEEAVRRGGRHGDNVSVLGLDWETQDAFEPTQVLPHAFASGGSPTETHSSDTADTADFDEAAIEQSIAEINEAIRRTARRKSSP
jgi:PPM family protein phosphatase